MLGDYHTARDGAASRNGKEMCVWGRNDTPRGRRSRRPGRPPCCTPAPRAVGPGRGQRVDGEGTVGVCHVIRGRGRAAVETQTDTRTRGEAGEEGARDGEDEHRGGEWGGEWG